MIMPFGKYKGEQVENIPTDYIEWILSTFEYSESNKSLLTELANQLVLRRGEGVIRDKSYVKDHEPNY